MHVSVFGRIARAGKLARSRLLAAALTALVPAGLAAQQPVTISGRVTSAAGTALAGAQVTIEQLGLGAASRGDGTYTVLIPAARVPSQAVTVSARLIGFKSQSTQLDLSGGSQTADFALADNPLQLGEIVVTGAGTESAVEKLGTVRSSVDSTSIQRSNEQNLINALAAKAPNVTVVSSSGDPGASSFIQIRGYTTISAADGQPLLVVDGVPIDNTTNYNNPTNSALNSSAAPANRAIDINPNDIESVEVLKGAASGAIYGSRAGQGVILITTKRGKAGPTKYSLRSTLSLDEHTQLPELQRKYGLGSGGATPACQESDDPTLRNCRVGFAASGSWGALVPDGTPTFDHSGEMFDQGYQTDNALTVSGGNDRTTFFLSGGYNYNRGIIVGPNNKYQRISVRFNGSHRLTDNFKVGANVAYVDGEGGAVVTRNSTDGLLLGAWRTTPTFNNLPYFDPRSGLHRSYRFPNPASGSERVGRSYDNPFFVAHEAIGESEVSRTFGGINAEWSPAGWLTFAYNLGLDYANDERTQGIPWSSSNTTIAGAGGVGAVNAGYIRTTQIDHNLTGTIRYSLSDAFKGSVTVGQNLNGQTFNSRQTLGTGLITPRPFNLANTASQLPPFDLRTEIRLESYFVQATADIGDRLFLSAAVRNDGASTFGADSRRNWFPKGSAAYVFRRATGDSWLTYGKIRAAYGQSGTQPLPYLLPSVYISTPVTDGGWGPASSTQLNGLGGLITQYNIPSTDLGPERVKEFEAGFDVGLFNDKADLSVTHYRQNSSGVILNLPVSSSTGYSEVPSNAASLQNRGWEVALNFRPVTSKDFGLDVGLQWSRNRSLTTDLAGVQFAPFPFSGGTNGLSVQGVAIEGRPVGVYYGSDFVRCGRGLILNDVDIDNTSGECQGAPDGALYLGADGYPVFDAAGFYEFGDPNPDWTGAVRTTVRVKRFSIGALVDVRHGGINHNGTKGALHHFGTTLESQIRREQAPVVFGQDYFENETVAGPGVSTAVPLNEGWFAGVGGIFNGASSQFVEPSGFVKLREVSLGLTLDQPWVSRTLGLGSIEFRVAGRNLFTSTDYTGVDPETSALGAATAVKGVDYFNNPQTRSFVFSLTLNR
ncbi:MAG: SusC/RagA family TonB-linked outer membrane protein [Gemmatimonadales bacterium]